MAIETPLRTEHEKLGATMAEFFGCNLPAHYGDPGREYKFARETAGLVDKNYRSLLSLTGADRVRYLNAMLTNDIRGLAPGQGTISLLLNPQGRILAEVETLALPDRLLCVSHAMIRERLVSTLEKFIIMDDVTLDDITDRMGTLALEGAATPALVRELCGLDLDSLPELGHAEAKVSEIACRIVHRTPGGVPAAEFIVERQHLLALWNLLLEKTRQHGGGPVGYDALNILRLEAGIPWYSYDFDENQIPHQAALEATHINFTKGCYTGQEIVERVRSQGNVQRRRVMLRFSGDVIPPRGEPLFAGGAEVGFVTRAARSPKFASVIGMGYVRREQIEPGSKVTWKGGEATVIESPGAPQSAGTSCH
ncbi:MAG TPA: glycine cleavage T C-terminal barrel domain-containing protein [Candidatus Acidoferrales bacterium]|nr:glycine cleavage T C-terminal barrel domain-containing protein [Candidatus Acidoferrales bacterium]HEV2342298.1 glycine cleavage T C-terminal barrel domain-containing protein [Candidatus Acidoferrales bacterium]